MQRGGPVGGCIHYHTTRLVESRELWRTWVSKKLGAIYALLDFWVGDMASSIVHH